MGSVLGSIAANLGEVIVFALIAWAGILCGKNMSMNKKAKAEGHDTK